MTNSKEARETIHEIVQKIVGAYTPEKVILFGSHAYGTPRADSDIDLLVIKHTSERFIDRWVTVRRILSDPSRMIPLEVIVLTPKEVSGRLAIGDQFIAEVIDKGEVLYAA